MTQQTQQVPSSTPAVPKPPAKGVAIKNFLIGGVSGMIATTFVSIGNIREKLNL